MSNDDSSFNHPNSDKVTSLRENSGESSDVSSASAFRMPLWAKLALLVAVIGLASVAHFTSGLFQKPSHIPQGVSEADPEEIAKRPLLPDAILTLANGEQKKLSDFRGNVVILSFWASWCAPCLEELPTFAQLEKRLGPQGFKVITVNVEEGDEGRNFAGKYWQAQSFTFPSFFDQGKNLVQQFEISTLPANFVIDRAGRLVFSSIGANDWNNSETIDTIESLLEEPQS